MTALKSLAAAIAQLTVAVRGLEVRPAPLTYSLPEAAGRLGGGFTVDWLKGHLTDLPHIKTGKGTGRSGRINFSETQLQTIITMFSVDPAPQSEPGDFATVRSRRGARRAS